MACWRSAIACWWEMFWSNGVQLMASMWSFSFSLWSLNKTLKEIFKMQHSDFITGLGNLNTSMQNSYARLNDLYKRNLLIRLSSPPYKLHAVHIVLNCPTKFCSNFITVCVYSISSFDYSKFHKIPSFVFDYIEL